MKTIVLVGAGHAHLEVIKALSVEEIQQCDFILVAPDDESIYSGLIPRLIMGEVETKDLQIQAAKLAKSKGFKIVRGFAKCVHAGENKLELESGQILNFDILSLNVGGKTRPIPTLARNSKNLQPLREPKICGDWRRAGGGGSGHGTSGSFAS